MKRDQLKTQVEQILRDYPKGRDSDVWLTLKIWTTFHSSKIQKDDRLQPYVYFSDILSLPREDNVKRIRANFQNVLNKYLPTTWEIAKKRKIEESIWRNYDRTGNFNETI